ncbi:MAG: ring-hydroxylating oxygenase subunit alpha [Alphaproteobacteria bacterium]|nr:ring-hydroxylating oxygenase subunit alpha [Alphaproteobacteria bacterium]
MPVRSLRTEAKPNTRNLKYGGYYQRDVPAPDPELTDTDPATPMGELMRRFWQPVCLSEQLTDLPHPIRIMGEDLVAFRDKSGRVGVLHRHCSHRGTSLEFGLLTERGIRCCYHGWLFDIDGTILETPGEPAGSRIEDRLCHGAYPALEKHGLVFAYMGPPEHKPDFPHYESIDAPGNKVYPLSNWFGCNWLQVAENTADPAHTSIFHNGVGSAWLQEGKPTGKGTALPAAWGAEMPVMEYRITEGGRSMVYIVSRRIGDRIWVRNNHFILPNYIEIGRLFEDATAEKYFGRVAFVRWVVPHDNQSSTIFGWRYFHKDIDPKGLGEPDKLGIEGQDFLDGQVGSNRSDEERRRYPGDWDVIMGQRTIAVHAKENPASTDVGVAMWRKLCRDAVRGRTRRALPKPANGAGEEPLLSYCQDTIFRIPAPADVERDQELIREMGRRVTDIVLDGDRFARKERSREIKSGLKALEKDLRKAYA